MRVKSSESYEQFIWAVTRQTGNKTAQFKSECCLIFCVIIEHPVDQNFILESCAECGEIRRYNINTAESKTVHERCKPWKVYKGPKGLMFVVDGEDELLQLEWREEKEQLELVHRIQTDVKNARGMCYIKQFNILVITYGNTIKALNPETGSVVWKFAQDVEDKELNPCGVRCDVDGKNLWLMDGMNG